MIAEKTWAGSLRETIRALFESEYPAIDWMKKSDMDQGDIAALYGWAVLGLDGVSWDRMVPYPDGDIPNAIAAIEPLRDYPIKGDYPGEQLGIFWDGSTLSLVSMDTEEIFV